MTAFDAIPKIYGAAITPLTANWWLSETLSYLRHLEVTGRVERIEGDARALVGRGVVPANGCCQTLTRSC